MFWINEEQKTGNTDDSESEESAPKAAPAPSSSKLVLIIALVTIPLISIAGFATFYILNNKDAIRTFFHLSKEKKEEDVDLMQIAYLTLPDMIVNLKTNKNKVTVLKCSFILELRTVKERDNIDHLKPVIIDQFQSYLREQEMSELQGSTGVERIRQELLNRVNAVISPFKIRRVLIKEFLIQ